MRPTISQYAQAIEELAASAAPGNMPAIVGGFVGLLGRRGEQRKLGAILKRLEQLGVEKEGRIIVTAVTAHRAAKDVQEKLLAEAQALFPDKNISLRYEVDADVIGGARFRTDETLYDATLSGEVQALRHSLLKA